MKIEWLCLTPVVVQDESYKSRLDLLIYRLDDRGGSYLRHDPGLPTLQITRQGKPVQFLVNGIRHFLAAVLETKDGSLQVQVTAEGKPLTPIIQDEQILQSCEPFEITV